MKWYLQAIRHYVEFGGRARRKEYWLFYLFNMIFGFVAALIDRALGLEISYMGRYVGYGVVGIVYSLFVMLPGLSLLFRRLHDIDKSAGWLFIGLVPVVGPIVLFIFSVMGGTTGENRYGKDPKAI